MPTAITDWSAAMMTSLAAALAMFLSAIPKIIGFVVILVVAWLVASLVERGVAALLRAIKFNDLAARSGLAEFVAKMGTGTDSAGVIGLVAKWFIRLIGLVVAFDALGLPAVSDVLRDMLLWLPNVIVALVVLVIGGLAARALSNLVRGAASEAGISNANLLAKVASVLVWAFAIVVAVNQIGIATTLVNTLFMAFVGAIALGLGLAFGLGGRETAGQILSQWYGSAQANSDKLARAAEAGGRMAGSGMGGHGGAPGSAPASDVRGAAFSDPRFPPAAPGGYAGSRSDPADGAPRGGAGAPLGTDEMYPTPSAPRRPGEY